MNRDFTILVDKSGSMGEPMGKTTRWNGVGETAVAVARELEANDPDGITVYTFSSLFKRFDNQTAAKVAEIFKNNSPSGSTNLHTVLEDVFNNYLSRKKKGEQKEGESVFIMTDGVPDSEPAVAEAICRFTKKLDSANEFSITFIQVGDDAAATKYLKKLDDDLEGQGAKYDIVDTLTVTELEGKNMADVIKQAISEHKQTKGAA